MTDEGKQHTWSFYQGKPLKSMRRVPGGIMLTFVSRVKGERGQQQVIQQADLDKYGEKRKVASPSMEHIRGLVPVV